MMLSPVGMWQFIRASAAAVVGSYRSLPVPEATAHIIGGVRGLVSLIGSEKAEPTVQADRLWSCWRCPLFDKKLRTCGTPGVVDKWGNPDGCWCDIPLVHKYKKKQCFLVATGDQRAAEYGWKA